MPSTPLIPLAKVTILDDADLNGQDTYPRARLTINGDPASVILFAPSLESPGSWRQVDRLTKAQVVQADDGSFTITGTSDELINMVGVAPHMAVTRWLVEPKGCPGCS